MSYIGAIGQLEAEGYEIATVSTCSAGTFVGALYCSGMSSAALREAALELDLRQLAGGSGWRSVRRLRSLLSWPYALNAQSGFASTFSSLLADHGRPSTPTLGDMHPPLSTAAVDVAAGRMLVYSTQANPQMPVTDLLSIAVALPLVYPPHARHGREVLDAAVATHSPVWLATGQDEDLPIVVLRAPAPAERRPRRNVVAWIDQVMYSSVVSRDTLLLERLPRVRVYDIETGVSGFDVGLSRAQVERIIDSGRRAVAEAEERRPEPRLPSRTTGDEDDRAEREAAGLYRRHRERMAASVRPSADLGGADSDPDGLTDGDEQVAASPLPAADTDQDTMPDGSELRDGTDARRVDSDGDRIDDPMERLTGPDPLVTDRDEDSFADGREYVSGPHGDERPSEVPPVPRPSVAGTSGEGERRLIDDDVAFSAYRPARLLPDRWHDLLVFAHKTDPAAGPGDVASDPLAEVERRVAQHFPDERAVPSSAASKAPLERGAALTIVPELSGVECNPRTARLEWWESVHQATFRVRASQRLAGTTVRGSVGVWCGPLIIAELQIALPVAATTAAVATSARSRVEPLERYEKIFPSYSHRDTIVVERCKEAAQALGHQYLQDVVALRSGDRWADRLLDLIDEADVFQLFWSSNSMRSPHCRREWERALASRKPLFIRPVYWEDPLPEEPELGLPPPALRALHFARLDRLAAEDTQPSSVRVVPRPPLPPSREASPAPPPPGPPSPMFPPVSDSAVRRRRNRWPAVIAALVLALVGAVLVLALL